jgi:hypothetical protein
MLTMSGAADKLRELAENIQFFIDFIKLGCEADQ